MSIVCPINPPGHDWANGLVCRWCDATRTVGEAIVEGLASRRGGDERSARVLLDAHRAEVLAEVTAWLTKRAREWRANGHYAEADATSVLASKVARAGADADLNGLGAELARQFEAAIAPE